MKQSLFKEFLSSKFEQSKEINKNYSLRAFSNRLKVSPSTLSEILNGKRRVGEKTIKSILEKLNADQELKENITRDSLDKKPPAHKYISTDQFQIISDWHFFAVQSLAETEDFFACPKWISKRLNIPETKAKNALEILQKNKLLIKDENDKLCSSNIHLATFSKIPSDVIQESHRQGLELAKDSVSNTPLELRDLSSITIALDPKDLPIAYEKIKRFRRSLNRFLETNEKKEVYRLNIQLFPLSSNKECGK